MARAITLIDKGMMEEIFNERLRDKRTGMITVYAEFQEEIMKYEQRKRAVSAMLGPASTPTPPAARTLPPAGAGRGLGGGGRHYVTHRPKPGVTRTSRVSVWARSLNPDPDTT